MALFSKRESVPEWASFFNFKEYTSFIAALDSYFKNTLNLTYEIDKEEDIHGLVLYDAAHIDIDL